MSSWWRSLSRRTEPGLFTESTVQHLLSGPQLRRRRIGAILMLDRLELDAYQLDRVQRGLSPDGVKPMPTIGSGVMELRIWDEAGTFRVMYVAKLADAVYVLHCFQKKTQQTAQRDIDLARRRFKALMKEISA